MSGIGQSVKRCAGCGMPLLGGGCACAAAAEIDRLSRERARRDVEHAALLAVAVAAREYRVRETSAAYDQRSDAKYERKVAARDALDAALTALDAARKEGL